MRPEARIERRQNTSRINSEKQRADTVIIMINPGSCKPVLAAQSGEGTETRPDKTQLQLMRLMERMSWDEMKIVNLLNFCEGNRTKSRPQTTAYIRLNVPLMAGRISKSSLMIWGETSCYGIYIICWKVKDT